MDSVSQFVLGAATCAAAVGARAPGVRAVLWGGVVATLPDLDVFIRHGDAIQDMTRHRAESHSLVWLTLVAPLLAFGIASLHRERHLFGRWWLGVWLALFTHPLLDALTIYGTQLLLPFTDHPFAIGSLFVVDPLYTLPLLVGVVALLVGRGGAKSRRWNTAGLLLSTAYAAFSLVAQQVVTAEARRALARDGIVAERLVVSPAPFQTLLWRVVAWTPRRVFEGYRSLLDGDAPMTFLPIERDVDLLAQLAGSAGVDRLTWFAGGYVKATVVGDEVRIADLRMGAEPDYVFTFPVAHVAADGALLPIERPQRLPFRVDHRQLDWLWRRALGERLPPPSSQPPAATDAR